MRRPSGLPVLLLPLVSLLGGADLTQGAPRLAYAQLALPPLPRDWPTTLQLGMSDPPGGAGALKASGGLRYRYQYLAGGVNTGQGWQTRAPDGAFVSN